MQSLSIIDETLKYIDGYDSTEKSIKIGLIGAGPSGLSLLNAFNTEIQKLHKNNKEIGFQVVCFEQQGNIGGQWNYTWQTSTNEYGESIHSSMYHDLWTNGPKECLEFHDYSFMEHFNGTNMGSFPPMKVMRDYILGRVKNKNILENAALDIKFNCKVINVKEIENGNKFQLKYKDLKNNTCHADIFDFVVVASGHFSTPNMVYFKGFENFKGRILHAHSFRNSVEFKGKNIVVIGSSYSAEDIALQCWKFGANSVTISYRTAAMGFKWPKGVTEVALLDEIIDGTAKFIDGTIVENIDAVILCTGYLHHFPFLDDNIRLKTNNVLAINNLYKGCLWINNPKLMFLGMQDQWYTFTMFDIQAFFVKDVILKNIGIPDKSFMINDVEKWMKREQNETKSDEDQIIFQTDYIIDVCKQILTPNDYAKEISKLDCSKQFIEWEHNRHNDIVTHRDKVHESNITGVVAAPFHTSWPDAFDDSIECYLGRSKQ